jgi:hypothetical protein
VTEIDWREREAVTFLDVYRELDSRAAAGTLPSEATILVRKPAFGALLTDLFELRRMSGFPEPTCKRCGKVCEHCAAEPGPPTTGDNLIRLYTPAGTVDIVGAA